MSEQAVCVICGEKARLRGRDYRSLCDRHYMEENHFIVVHDVVEANGKTIRENNQEKTHRIPIGTLVEVKYDTWFGNGACEKVHARLWVVHHGRDCDGTPLYGVSPYRDALCDTVPERIAARVHGGMAEESLTPIEVTPDLVYGIGVLEWPDDE